MQFVNFILDYGVTIISILATIVLFVIYIIKAHRSGNTKGLLAIYSQIPQLVSKAEQIFGAGNGVAKLNYVLTELRFYAMQHGINITQQELEQQVENVVTTTKNVNTNKTAVDVTNIEQTNTVAK